jgi:hypothetical protein
MPTVNIMPIAAKFGVFVIVKQINARVGLWMSVH